MKTLFLTLIVVIITVFVVPASKLSTPQKLDNLNFEERINIIHSKIVDLTNIFSLHHVKEFNEVYLTPLNYREPIIQYLQKPVTYENKVIAICMMTKLPLNDYIDILKSYFDLYNKSKINEQLLKRCIFNEFDTDYRLAKQYKNPLVRPFLREMLECRTLSKDFKSNIKETLNGKWYNDLKGMGHL